MTGPVVLMIASGNVNGFALIEIPLMEVTLIKLGPVAGRARANGTDFAKYPKMFVVPPEKVPEKLSARIKPSPP
jgi:hypothetical protein